jgi:putative transposase
LALASEGIRARLLAVPKKRRKNAALAAAMARPQRNSDQRSLRGIARTFFVTSKTIEGRGLLQSERNAMLFIDTLRSYAQAGKFTVHDFVVMPNHVHLLITLDNTMSVEKAVQFIKGGFSYRVKKELGYLGEIWQKGFSEVRITDRASFLQHREYIDQNPIRAGLADAPEKFPYGSAYFKKQKKSRG